MDVDGANGPSVTVVGDEADSNLLDMPPSKLLTHRVKHILKAFTSNRKRRNATDAKERKRLEKEKEKEEKTRRRADKETNWSKREKTEYARTIQANGIPLRRNPLTGETEEDWDNLHARSALHNKSAAAMQAFYQDFIMVIRYMAAVKMRTTHDEKIDDSLLHGFTDAQMSEKAADLHVTGMAARRIWERVTTFEMLRREVLTQGGLDTVLSRATPVGYGFPSWWLVPQFDVALLRAVDKHGFGKWHSVCTDPTMPFMEAAKSYLGAEGFARLVASGSQGKDDDDDDFDRDDDDGKGALSNFGLPTEKVLWKRVQHLVAVATGSTDAALGGAATSAPPGRLNGKRGKTAAMDVDEDDFDNSASGNKKKRRRDAGANDAASDLADPTAKRPRGAAAAEDVKIDFDSNGQPILPINIKGVLTVESLGTIHPSASFHNEKYIWPLNFVSKREYLSTVSLDGKTKYKCEILESSEGTPLFRVTPEDAPGQVYEASSASQAWKLVLDQISKVRPDAKRNSVSGPEYFGYGHPKISELIAKLPGNEACARYHAAQAPFPAPNRKKRDGRRHDDDVEEMDQDD